jgi:hypothetical protein
MICGVKTLSIPALDRTSIELPMLRSGSKELITFPGVASTWMVPTFWEKPGSKKTTVTAMPEDKA